jgi:DNA polymerase epsilon subunit 1
VFKSFLEGGTLEECYAAVARVADHWLDILKSKGAVVGVRPVYVLRRS